MTMIMTTTTTTAAEVAILGHLHCATHYAGPFPGSYNYSSQPHFTDENTDPQSTEVCCQVPHPA